MDDLESVFNAKRGNARAFETLIVRHTVPAYRLAHLIVLNRADAEDVIQDAFFRAWQHIAAFDERRGTFKTWIGIITRNAAYDLVGSRRREREILDQYAIEPSPVSPLPDAALRLRELLVLVDRRLPPHARDLVLLADVHGCTYREISAIMSVPIGTVMSGLSRARTALAA